MGKAVAGHCTAVVQYGSEATQAMGSAPPQGKLSSYAASGQLLGPVLGQLTVHEFASCAEADCSNCKVSGGAAALSLVQSRLLVHSSSAAMTQIHS